MSTTPVFKISPGIQSYAWGKKGEASLAAQLGKGSIQGFEIDQEKPYAELWMGTHPNVPSHVLDAPSPTTLASHCERHHDTLLGEKVTTRFEDAKEGNLPFLFKVLSIGTALSIQAHPDKELAKRLFTERPDVYKDPNHKPEMAIALTPFTAFLNFLPLPTILLHLLTVAEFSSLIPKDLIDNLASSLSLPHTTPTEFNQDAFAPTPNPPTSSQKDALKAIFDALMSTEEKVYQSTVEVLVERYKQEDGLMENEKPLRELVLTLNEQYPGDIGVLCVFLLNVVELKEGEAAFLGADMPHAYISGDIIECMATSDNVVRAGLTPKLRDVPTLVSMLTYEAGPGSNQLLKPVPFQKGDDTTLLYDPPIDEFSVLKVSLSTEKGKASQRPIQGPSISIITKGEGQVRWSEGKEELKIARGDVIFIGAGTEIAWEATGELEAFRAYVEV